MTLLLLGNIFFAGFSSLTVTSRIGFAMARDSAFPFSSFLKQVNLKTKTPIVMVFLTFLVDSLLCMLPLVSSTAFAAITSITTIGYQISYAIPIGYRVTVARKGFRKSEFNLGRFSLPIGCVSFIWLISTSVIFMLPTQLTSNHQVTAENFNYTPVVVLSVLLISATYWFLPSPYGARHFYKGPRREDSETTETTEAFQDLPQDLLQDEELL